MTRQATRQNNKQEQQCEEATQNLEQQATKLSKQEKHFKKNHQDKNQQ